MSIQEKVKCVHKSYVRAGGKLFITAFYARLMKSSEDIRKKFEHVDMEAQTAILDHAIVMSFLFVGENHQSATKCLNNVRESHNRHNLNIAPELYDSWLECLVATVEICDPRANKELLADWHMVMSVAVNYIRGGY